MRTGLSIPEVSLITSWRIADRDSSQQPTAPYGMWKALQEGINLLDLYFLDHKDIPWYKQFTHKRNVKEEPHAFAASLDIMELENIAGKLKSELAASYSGKLVGRRPRFAAIATYFPDISLPLGDEDPGSKQRNAAVSALRNTLYLAHSLGCGCVEIVGGAGMPGPRYQGQETPETYRSSRRSALAQSLCEIYDASDPTNPLTALIAADIPLPVIAIELEPGISHLLNKLEEFSFLRDAVAAVAGSDSPACRSLYLNVDVAHAFLLGYTPEHLRASGLALWVAHIHLSDHAGHKGRGGAHASDLTPGTFHKYDEYKPWLQFAIELSRLSNRFSGVIAIEMEACNDDDVMLAAVNTTRRWLQQVNRETYGFSPVKRRAQSLTPADMKTGALLVVDVGKSTDVFFGKDPLGGCLKLQQAIEALCRAVQRAAGSVMSFTGDGFIALFEEAHFSSAESALQTALGVAYRVSTTISQIPEMKGLTGRAALHWGEAYIPASGQLRDQIIGIDVVCAARVCHWLHDVEEGIEDKNLGSLVAVTDIVHKMLPEDIKGWQVYHNKQLPGVRKPFTLYVSSIAQQR